MKQTSFLQQLFGRIVEVLRSGTFAWRLSMLKLRVCQNFLAGEETVDSWKAVSRNLDRVDRLAARYGIRL